MFNRKVDDIIEKRFIQLNIPLLYMIYINKKFIYSNFKEEDVSNKNCIDTIKILLKNFIKEYKNNYDSYYMDLLCYIIILRLYIKIK